MNDPERARRLAWRLLLAAIAVLGFALRTWNIDWDAGQHLHPDERHWSFVLDRITAPDDPIEYFDTGDSPLNPYASFDSFAYGTLPLFATKLSAAVLESGPARPLVDVLDTFGVDLVRPDGSLRFDGRYQANLVGRLLSAICDSITIVLVGLIARLLAGRRAGVMGAAAYAIAVLPIQQAHFLGSDPWATMFVAASALAALHYGLGRGPAWLVASTALAGAAISCRVTALGVLLMPAAALAIRLHRATDDRRRQVAALGAGVVAATLVFRVTNPYAFSGLALNPKWTADVRSVAALAADYGFPPAVQWVGRGPIYPLTQIVQYGLGPGSTLLAVTGCARLWRERHGSDGRAALGVLAMWPVGWIALAVISAVRTMRYNLPVYPLLALLAGLGAAGLIEAARAHAGWRRRASVAVLGVAGASAVVWGAAFVHGVYGHTNSRVAATEWIAANVPAGSAITVDAWDDGIPLALPGVPSYASVQLEPFAVDSYDKVRSLVERLDSADVIAVTSSRASGSVPRLPVSYPATIRYFEALADGRLGWQPLASFQNRPSLGPLRFDTAGAEEAFSVYDHPPVALYVKTDDWSPQRALAILDPWSAQLATHVVGAHTATANAAMLTPAASEHRSSATFDDLFRRRGATAVALWVGWLLLSAVALIPAARRLFADIPAAVPAVALVAGPVTIGVGVWTLAAWDVVDFSAAAVWVVSAIVWSAGGLWWRRDRQPLIAHWRSNRSAWIGVIAASVASFAAVLVVRSLNPDLWASPYGGEKPMELAYFTSIARTSVIPAPDPWFAGGAMNYYYLGWFLLAVPTRALAILPEVAFQLGLATVVAFTVALVYAFAHGASSRLLGSRRSATVAGITSVAMVTVAGNLDTVRQVGRWALDGGQLYDWWRPSRAHLGQFDITEFPAWSIMFGDLHPHVMSWWIDAAVAIVCLTIVGTRSSAAGDPGRSPGRSPRRLALAAVGGALLGISRMTNTWDLPALTVLLSGSIIAATWSRQVWRTSAVRVAEQLALAAVTAQVLTAPYRRRTVVFTDGLRRSPETTRLVDHLVHVGPFLALGLLTAIAVVPWAGRRRRVWLAAPAVVAVSAAMLGVFVSWAAAATWLAAIPLAGAIALACRHRPQGERATLGLLGGAGVIGLTLTVVGDVAIVSPDISRMNTVFKFGLQGWILLALFTGPAVVLIAASARHWSGRWRGALSALAVPVLVVMLAFPALAYPPRLSARFAPLPPTLDGLAYLDRDPEVGGVRIADDLALIEWVRANVAGDANLVEMSGEAYGWNTRVADLTGIPTVVGWTWHQIQQRQGTPFDVQRRAQEVRDFYRSRDRFAAARFVATYDVEYVVIGTQELPWMDAVAIAVIEAMPGATTVFRSGDTRVVQVDLIEAREALAANEWP